MNQLKQKEDNDLDNILSALNSISCAEVDYSTWVQIGMALKAEGMDVDPSRTADASSVLRLPGTWRHQSGWAR